LVLTAIFQVSRYQNNSTLDFIGAKGDGGGDNWSCKTCKAPARSSPPTNQHPTFYSLNALPIAQPTVSKHQREKASLSLHFNGHFPGEPGLAGVYWSKGWWRWRWQLDYWSLFVCLLEV